MKKKQLTAIALAAAMAMGTFGFSVPVKADEAYSTEYEITIPSELNVANKGWNRTDGITAKLGNGVGSDTAFDTGKKLTVTAASANSWALKSGENTVGYNLAIAGDANSVYSDAQPALPSWEFAADEITTEGTNKPMGIIVEDYSSKPAGSYTDTVTFTAKVVDAATPATPLDNTTTAWTAGTFAVPAGGLTYNDAITVSGDVTLVLTDGETLTLNKGISLASGATLTIQGNGAMAVNGTNNSTASTVADSTGTLILTSGTLTATGGNGAGVGDRSSGTDNRANAGGNAINGNVTVSGGTLTAIGGNGGSIGARIMDAYGAVGGVAISGSVTVTGGTVTATGGNGGSIGARSLGSYGGSGGAAIGGDATVNDGTWRASDGTHGENGYGQGGDGGKAVAGTVTDNR